MSDGLNRRDVLKLGGTAALAWGFGDLACSRPAVLPPGKYLTGAELALVDELSEIIIPANDRSPGARAVKAAAFIDERLAESFEEADRTDWRAGLARIEHISREMHGRALLDALPEQRVAVVTRLAANEAKPQAVEEKFFAELKERVVHAYYSSEIGIHRELQYKGNVFLQEFEGTDVSRHS